MASTWTSRTRFLLLAAGVLLVGNLLHQTYRWYVYADERQELRRMTADLETAGLTVIRTQLVADSLRGVIESADAGLRESRLDIDRIERRAQADGLPPTLYEEYRRGLDRYNQRVAARNEKFERWRGIVARNHHAVDRYNLLADSMRLLGARMGEPYLAIPSPAELAVRNGLAVDTSTAP